MMTIGNFEHAAHALQVHRPDAAVGFSRISSPRHARACPAFDLRMCAEATDLIMERRARCGRARAKHRGRNRDPRRSDRRLRRPPFDDCANARDLKAEDFGAPMDVMWFRISRKESDPRRGRRSYRKRPNAGDAQPQRLLAMRLCDSQRRRGEQYKATRPRCVSGKASATSRRSCATGWRRSTAGTR